jgi:hypothetical protein
VLFPVLLAQKFFTCKTPASFRSSVSALCWVVSGILLVLIPVTFYFIQAGVFDRVLLLFQFGFNYLEFRNSNVQASQGWYFFAFHSLFFENPFIISYVLMSFYFLFQIRSSKAPCLEIIKTSLPLWLFLSYIEASTSRIYFSHYYLLLIPPLSLLSGFAIVKIKDSFLSPISNKTVGNFLFIVIISLPILFSVQRNRTFFSEYISYKMGKSNLEGFLKNGWPYVGEQIQESLEISRYIRENSNEDDHIYVWSSQRYKYITYRTVDVQLI